LFKEETELSLTTYVVKKAEHEKDK